MIVGDVLSQVLYDGRLLCTCELATLKLLSQKLLCIHGTMHVLLTALTTNPEMKCKRHYNAGLHRPRLNWCGLVQPVIPQCDGPRCSFLMTAQHRPTSRLAADDYTSRLDAAAGQPLNNSS